MSTRRSFLKSILSIPIVAAIPISTLATTNISGPILLIKQLDPSDNGIWFVDGVGQAATDNDIALKSYVDQQVIRCLHEEY